MTTAKHKKTTWVAIVAILAICQPARAASGGERRIKIGSKMPEFSVVDSSGNTIDYRHGAGHLLMVAFFSNEQKRSARAAADITAILKELRTDAKDLLALAVIDDPNCMAYFRPGDKDTPLPMRVVLDTQYTLWGKLGAIATPTVVISGKDDKVLWVKAGYGYDFAPATRAHLAKALGVAQDTTPEDAGHVETVTNDTVAARVKRHLQMANILIGKARFESAIHELEKSRDLDPNSVETVLQLGELYCLMRRSQEALEVIRKVQGATRRQKARVRLIMGWARRQTGDLETARQHLLEATQLDPKSGRAFFELGRVYQALGDKDKALNAYYTALTLAFPAG
ncbi:MAG: tetratricopeptide repeat protein [Phycisphaerales bacterium]|nr:MAG: tetratricopeptide repeat protein [Phycisphaerales bacterium]